MLTKYNKVKPYGSTLKDKVYYILEYSTNINNLGPAAFFGLPIILTAGVAVLPLEYLWTKAVDYSHERQRQNGIKYPWTGTIHLDDVIDLLVKEAKRLLGER